MGTKTKAKVQEKQYDEEEQKDRQKEVDRREVLKQKGESARRDIQNLKVADKTVPNSEKQLAACTICKIILSIPQWKSRSKKEAHECPNKCVNFSYTSTFSGMISIFMPSQSWVARRNGLRDCIPGIYAISIRLDDQDDLKDERPYKKQKKRGN